MKKLILSILIGVCFNGYGQTVDTVTCLYYYKSEKDTTNSLRQDIQGGKAVRVDGRFIELIGCDGKRVYARRGYRIRILY